MKEDTIPAPQDSTVSPIIRIGDEIIFKYEGNLRAKVVGYETVDGKVWFVTRACLGFNVPFSQVLGVEKE